MKKLFFISATMFAPPKSFIEDGGGTTEATEEAPVVEEAPTLDEAVEQTTDETKQENTASTADVVNDGEAD